MKVAVLTSGGVDSSVALGLLKDRGYNLEAFYIKIWLEDDFAHLGECPWEEDLKYVRSICEKWDIPLNIVPLQREYWELVIEKAVEELREGRTPNPDIFCNSRIKFGLFYETIDDSFSFVATGHYARKEEVDGVSYLKLAADPKKDQTYFLSYLSQQQLSRALFPIGDYTKAQVRELAEQFGLPNSRRKDSQGLCFLGTIKFRDFIKLHLGEREGDFVEYETGKKIGRHRGFWFYTVGQRQGLGLSGGPWYVVKKVPSENIVYISRNYRELTGIRRKMEVSKFNWISDISYREGQEFECRVKVRHGPEFIGAKVRMITDDRAEVTLERPDQGLAPGQFCVFYSGDKCLGAAVITEQILEGPMLPVETQS